LKISDDTSFNLCKKYHSSRRRYYKKSHNELIDDYSYKIIDSKITPRHKSTNGQRNGYLMASASAFRGSLPPSNQFIISPNQNQNQNENSITFSYKGKCSLTNGRNQAKSTYLLFHSNQDHFTKLFFIFINCYFYF
jgi:hypothetical protein